MSNDVNLQSVDAMFARVLGRLDQQDRVLEEIRQDGKESRTATEARFKVLEAFRSNILGKVAGFIACASIAGGLLGFAVQIILSHFTKASP